MPNAAEFSIGLDLGGTNLQTAAISHDGRLLDSVRGHTAWSEGRERSSAKWSKRSTRFEAAAARRNWPGLRRRAGFIVLAMLVNTFNFPLYLLSGGVPGAWDLFAPAMIEETRRRSFTFRATNTCIEKAALGDDAGLFGAARLPWLVVS